MNLEKWGSFLDYNEESKEKIKRILQKIYLVEHAHSSEFQNNSIK